MMRGAHDLNPPATRRLGRPHHRGDTDRARGPLGVENRLTFALLKAGPPRYQRQVGEEDYEFAPSPEEQTWYENFIRVKGQRDGKGAARAARTAVASV